MEDAPANDDPTGTTETSPLLATGLIPEPSVQKRSNGTFADLEGSASEGDGEILANPDGPVGREGLPAVATKLPILIPAIGIGVGPPLKRSSQPMACVSNADIGFRFSSVLLTSSSLSQPTPR